MLESAETELQSPAIATTLPSATTIRRKRGPSLSRRSGQQGNVVQKSQPWDSVALAYGRFWVDTPCLATLGVRQVPNAIVLRWRSTKTARVHRSATNQQQADLLRKHFSGHNFPGAICRVDAIVTRAAAAPVETGHAAQLAKLFGQVAAAPLGDTPLAQIGNAALRMLVDKMQAAGLAPKTIVNYSQVVKLVLASALSVEGEQLYPRKWNHDFIGMPVVLVTEQRRPTLTSEQVAAILARAESPYRVLFALLAGTGLRIGEALALKASDFSSDFKSIEVRRSMWHGREQSPKTPSAVRVVDLAEPLATLLSEYAAGKAGYLFAFANGTPMVQRHALYKLHAAAGKVGLHAFRRFRTSVLRKARVPEDLIALWLGHSGRSVTDTYARQLREDVPFRQEWAERAGLSYVGLQNVVAIDSVRAA